MTGAKPTVEWEDTGGYLTVISYKKLILNNIYSDVLGCPYINRKKMKSQSIVMQVDRQMIVIKMGRQAIPMEMPRQTIVMKMSKNKIVKMTLCFS